MMEKRWKFVAGISLFALALPVCGCSANSVANGTKPAVETASNAAVDSTYRIGPGDVLSISVWKNPDLTRVVQVLPDGKISFPLIGQVTVSDMSVSEIITALKEKIAPFSPDPELSVEVQQANSLAIYVTGRTNRPGRFEYRGNVDVLQALAMAGGLTPFAKRSDIKVFRSEKEGTKVYSFDYDAVTEGKALNQNISLKRGDVVVVP